jgi:hypothetical protein
MEMSNLQVKRINLRIKPRALKHSMNLMMYRRHLAEIIGITKSLIVNYYKNKLIHLSDTSMITQTIQQYCKTIINKTVVVLD